MFEEKRLSNDGTDTARSEQADQGSKEMDKKNHQMAHRRMVARRGILRNHGRNNNLPATRQGAKFHSGCETFARRSALLLKRVLAILGPRDA